MVLEHFLIDLIQSGQVTVPNQIIDFELNSSDESLILLEEYYRADVLTMPHMAPPFHPDAALWAAKYIFSTIQLVLLRDIGEEKMNSLLGNYTGGYTPESIYSADLTLRFLPDIFKFASGLSPDDPLVARLKTTAQLWPFSSVGITDVSIAIDDAITAHPSLRQAYIDRIIQKKDTYRLQGEKEKKLVKEALGIHQASLWPGLNLILNEDTI